MATKTITIEIDSNDASVFISEENNSGCSYRGLYTKDDLIDVFTQYVDYYISNQDIRSDSNE